MLSYDRLRHSPRALCTFTGLDKAEGEKLLVPFVKIGTLISMRTRAKSKCGSDASVAAVKQGSSPSKTRCCLSSCLPKSILCRKSRVLFNRSQGRANEWLHKLSTVLQRALGDPRDFLERHPQNLEPVLALCVSVAVIIDGTERRTRRPTEAEKPKTSDNGKKRIRCTITSSWLRRNGSCATSVTRILAVGHDSRICDEEA